MIELLFRIIVGIRVWISPFIYKKFYRKNLSSTHELWDSHYKWRTMKSFSEDINAYDYEWDYLHGLLDASFSSNEPDYFFQSLTAGRDCDDFARIWRLWGEAQGWKGEEYIFTDKKKPFSKAHVVTILEENPSQFWLMNYSPYGPYSTKEEAIQKMTDWYEKETMIYVRYAHEKERY